MDVVSRDQTWQTKFSQLCQEIRNIKTHSHDKNPPKGLLLPSSKLDNYKPGTMGTDGEDGRHGIDSPYSTLSVEPGDHNSGNLECCGSPESCTSPSPPPVDVPPPMSHIGPPLPGSPVPPPFSTSEGAMDDNAALSQSSSSEGVPDEWALDWLAGVLRVGESNQLDWRETREGQEEEGLPDPDSPSGSTGAWEGPVPPPPTDLPESRREDMICQKRSS